MKYSLFPGCSLERNAAAYLQSTLAISKPLDLEFVEIDDWNCCGASEYISLNKTAAYALVARNLAQACKADGLRDLVAPCSACYLNMSKVDKFLGDDARLLTNVNIALAEAGLSYKPGSIRTRHLIDVIVTDIGYDAVAAKVTKPLEGLRLAPYYGCWVTRPGYGSFVDDFEYPTCLDKLLKALGAEVIDFPMKAHCCGGHMTQISETTALEMIHKIVKNAVESGADAIVTICPMCQLNLDVYQGYANNLYGTDYHMPVLFFTQVIGLALGLSPKELGFGQEFADASHLIGKIQDVPPAKVKPARRSKEALPMPIMPE